MSDEDAVEVLHRNRFQAIAGATVERISSNAWTVRIPVDDPIHRKVRRQPTPEGWDGAVFFVDGLETEPALGSGLRRGVIEVSAFAV